MVPSQTNPLAKSIRSLEGILVAVSDVVLAVVAIVPAHGLDPKLAAGLVVAQHVALLLQRGVIKSKALSSAQISDVLAQNLVKAAVDPQAELTDLGAIAKEVEQEVAAPAVPAALAQ